MSNEKRFDGKVAFVTGAGSGIGRATALAFAREGTRVAALDRDQASVEETARTVETAGGHAVALVGDVGRSEDVRVALQRTVEAFGRLDVAFNNAGVEQKDAPVAELEEDEWDRVVNASLRGMYLCMKHEIPLLLEAGGGAIVNTSSGAGIKGFPAQPAYLAAKHGIVGMTKGTALDYATKGIRVNAVCPGMIDTSMMARVSGGTPEGYEKVVAQEPVGRMGTPEEIAEVVLFLCSPAASFVTGAAIVADGGQTA